MTIKVEIEAGETIRGTITSARRLARILSSLTGEYIAISYDFNETRVLVNRNGVFSALDKDNKIDESFY